MESSAIEIVFSFVDEDLSTYQEIQKHLRVSQRAERFVCWSHRDVEAGQDWAERMRERLEIAPLVVILLSPDYLASDQHYEVEAGIALRRQKEGQAQVVPILVRSCNLTGTAFAPLQLVPADQHPISAQVRADETYREIAQYLHDVLQSLPPASAQQNLNQVWTVPYPRNTLFIGREAELSTIEATLRRGQHAAVGQTQALSGLGGIGKTQIALEYAYRHRQDYRYIFWVLADTRDTLSAHYSQLAEQLALPGSTQAELRYIVEIFKRWLETNQDWLLILDNADDLSIIPDFLPQSTAAGHVLLTTRSQVMGRLAERIDASKLGLNDGVTFLLLRSGLSGRARATASLDPKEQEAAWQIVRELDGLPLALDQAGAYIEETSCGLSGYLTLYRQEHKALLKQRGGHVADHPDSVVQTVQLAFKKVEQSNPAAADLLRLCAFLAPEAIPELLIEKGEAELSTHLKPLARKPLKLNAAIAELQKYSLVSRNAPAKTLDVHRLVQVVLRDAMPKNTARSWAERVVRLLNRVFPHPDVDTWEVCRILLPHVQEVVAFIDQWRIETDESERLLSRIGGYLHDRAEYREARHYYEKALALAQKRFGTGHIRISVPMNRLGLTYREQGKYEQALKLHEQALAIERKAYGEVHSVIANSLGYIGLVYYVQGKYEQAFKLHEQTLMIRRKVYGETNSKIAASLGNMGLVYQDQGKYDQALDMHEQALAIDREVYGSGHPRVAENLGNIGLIYHEQGKYEQALKLYEQALMIDRSTYGEAHPDTAKDLNNMAETYVKHGKYEEAEQLHQQAQAILRKALGDEHPLVALSLNNQGELFLAWGKSGDAEQLFQQALTLQRRIWKEAHPDTARSLANLGRVARVQGKIQEAQALFQEAQEIYQATIGAEHPRTREALALCEEMAQTGDQGEQG